MKRCGEQKDGAHHRLGVRTAAVLIGAALVVMHSTRSVAAVNDFEAGGECTEAVTAIPVDADAADRLVPDRFEIRRANGHALLSVFSESCETEVNGSGRTPSYFGGAFVVLNPAGDPSGCESYSLFWTNSERDDWYRAMSRIGWNMELVSDSHFELTTVAGLSTVDSSIPFDDAAFTLDFVSLQPAPEPRPVPSFHCYESRHGLVTAAFDHTEIEFNVGKADVMFEPSPLWDALGARSGSYGGLLLKFTWTGNIEIDE